MMGFGDLLRVWVNTLWPLLLLTLIFYALEQLAPAEKGQAASKRLFNVVYLPFVLLPVFLLQSLLSPSYSNVLRFAGGGLLPVLIDQPGGLATHLLFAVSFALVWDLWQYWVHRLQHNLPFFWETHKFHHSESALNSSTHGRTHILSHVLHMTFYLPVLILFGTQTPHFIALFAMFKLWGFFNHMNARLDLGPLTPIISGPQWHRIHHSAHTEHHGKNFAAFFPFIDILFGTYYRPRKGEYPVTGLSGEKGAGDLWEATIAPLFAWYRMATRNLSLAMRQRVDEFERR